MKIIECDQYSDEWWSVRRGIPTASSAGKVYTSTGKASTSQTAYIHNLVAEFYDLGYGIKEEHQTAAMRQGHVIEPEARSFYEFDRGIEVKEVGFCLTDDGRFGCSPDGLVGDDGGIEIKSPQTHTQVKYLLAGKVPAEYVPQIHWSLVVTGRAWWDFLSYCRGLPKLLIRVEPDEYTEQMAEAMDAFYSKYRVALKKIQDMTDPAIDAYNDEQDAIAVAQTF